MDEQKKIVSFCEEEIRGDTAELATKKWSPGFFRKKQRGDTLSCRPGCHPSDATEAASCDEAARQS